MIITVYRIHSRFYDKIKLTRPSSDVIYTEHKLVLPAGYELGNTRTGEPAIFDEAGDHCELCPDNLHGATILAVNTRKTVALKKAPEGREPVPMQEARLAAGLTLQQLAEASGVNTRQIQRIELGESEAGNMTARNLLAIADALGVDPRDLIGTEEDK